jgi:hypothetical protein
LSKAIHLAHSFLVITNAFCCSCLLDVSTVASDLDLESASSGLSEESGLTKPDGFEAPAGLELAPWPPVRCNPGFSSPF